MVLKKISPKKSAKKVDSENDANTDQPVGKQWKKSESGKRQKCQYLYKTVDEVLATGISKLIVPESQKQLTKVKVMDMTGKEQKMLSCYKNLSNRCEQPSFFFFGDKIGFQPFDVPELQHNIHLLVRKSEDELSNYFHVSDYVVQNDSRLKYESEKIKSLCEHENGQIIRLKEVLGIVQLCQSRSRLDSEHSLSLQEITEVLNILRNSYYDEYKLYNLSMLAVALVSLIVIINEAI